MTSAINPNNINGNYPVANQPNNTQGFRDNFTNTKTNFQSAADEITDLQNKAVLKVALTGGTLDNNMNNQLIYAALIQDFSATAVAITATSGSIAVDYSAGHYQTIVPTGSISLSFANFPVSGTAGLIRLRLTIASVAYTVTLPSAVSVGTTGIQGLSANTITFGAAGTYEFDFETVDGGTTITIFDLNRPLSYYTNPVTIANTAVSTNAGSGALIVAGGVGVAGNLYVTGDIVGNFVVTGQTFTGNVTADNFLSRGLISATSNVIGGNISTAGLVTATGNIIGSNLNAAGLSLSGNVLSAINMTANITTTGGNLQAGNLLTGGIASATGNITGGNLRTTGQVSATANVTGGNLLTGGIASATGNITGGNLRTTGQVSATANVTGGNLNATGQVSATGNITSAGNVAGNYFLGNGSQLTGISSLTTISSGTTNMTVNGSGGNISATIGGTSNVAVFASTGLNVLGSFSASGNISATGNIVTGSGNVTGGNLTTAGLITATGNIVATANVNGGNLTTANQVVATGNVTGGNIRTPGQVVAATATAITAGGSNIGLEFSPTADFGIFFGSGVPTISAAKGSLYLRSDGSTTNNRMYVNTDGATTWTAVTTAI